MAIKIEGAENTHVVGAMGGRTFRQKVEIMADTEAEITALPGAGGEVTDDFGVKVKLNEGSMAYTADMTVLYMLNASGVWTKTV